MTAIVVCITVMQPLTVLEMTSSFPTRRVPSLSNLLHNNLCLSLCLVPLLLYHTSRRAEETQRRKQPYTGTSASSSHCQVSGSPGPYSPSPWQSCPSSGAPVPARRTRPHQTCRIRPPHRHIMSSRTGPCVLRARHSHFPELR
ncbi:hypothetical protein EI94DRAFT_1140748 [Lactarius quietus]|nr:hypothetical protein EI94DRAFT_1140748 [Lactarius quietus]